MFQPVRFESAIVGYHGNSYTELKFSIWVLGISGYFGVGVLA